MTNRELDDQLLSQWLDGELDSQGVRQLRDRLGADPELERRKEQFQRSNDAARAWFEFQDAAVPAELEKLVTTQFRRKRNARPGFLKWLPAAAAAAIVLIGGIGFDYMIDQRVNAVLENMQAEQASNVAFLTVSVQEALETRVSGVAVQLQNASTGFSVTLMPKRTWKSASGHWCREFTEAFGAGSNVETTVSVACRSDNGVWQRVRTAIELPSAPIIPHRIGEQSL